jgi:cation diffusion facilitator family transporter
LSAENHGTKAILAAFIANLGIAIAKFVGFLITASGSMLAESVHSLADTANQALLLLGGRRAKRAPDDAHPFGFGRERYFWAFVVAVVLFTMGAAFAIIDGVEKILHPHELENAPVAIAILLVAVVLEGFSFRTALHEARAQVGPDTPLWRYIREAKAPEVPVVLLEDSAALLGLLFALSAVIVSHQTGDAVWDGIGTVAIGVLLACVATVLAIEMKSLLIGESATPARQQAIRDALLSGDEVRSIIHLRTEHLGPDDLLVAAKVEMDGDLTYEQMARAIDASEVRVRAAEPAARMLFIEPDVVRDPSIPPSDSSTTDPSEN